MHPGGTLDAIPGDGARGRDHTDALVINKCEHSCVSADFDTPNSTPE